jgi:hypothetical protein
MAEHFDGHGHTVHFSNGGCESLLRAWVTLGERLGPAPEAAPVLAYLRKQLDNGRGLRSFSLAPPPDELAAPERLRCLARIVAAFARELARPDPDPSLTDFSWDRELRLSWLARQMDLYELIDAALPAGAEPLPCLDLDMPPPDQLDCALRRSLDWKYELRRAAAACPEALLVVTDHILALSALQPPSPGRSDLRLAEYEDRSNLLRDLGDTAGAAAALRAGTAEATDRDVQEFIGEMAAQLEPGPQGVAMTEDEWLTSDDVFLLLSFLRGRLSDRRFRLFACACARRAWPRLWKPETRAAVEVAERFVDGRACDLEFQAARMGTMVAYRAPGLAGLAAATVGLALTGDDAVAAARDASAAALTVMVPSGHHGRAARARERLAQCQLLRDIAGNPFRSAAVANTWLAWNDGIVPKLAQAIYDEGAFDRLPVLADALEEAGCEDAELLRHCRGGGEHVRGCWAVDLVLRRE